RRHRESERRHARGRGGNDGLPGDKGGPGRQAGFTQEWKPLLSECHVVIEQDPDDEHRSEGVYRHEGGVERPLLLYDPPIENRQPWDALHADEGRGGELPSIVARIEPLW